MTLKDKNITHIGCLKKGDRFYFSNDSHKTVWQIDYHTAIWFRGESKKATWCQSGTGEIKRFLSKRVVIHLVKGKEKPITQLAYLKAPGLFGYHNRPKSQQRVSHRPPSTGIKIKKGKINSLPDLFKL